LGPKRLSFRVTKGSDVLEKFFGKDKVRFSKICADFLSYGFMH